ncbi:MAG: alpha/beta hydrolase [Burkholderiales bacterium]|jgi:pimeloyl-ACP methyl ester carboxylesterase|nr:alpha/beta hydrolase [Burkholderiales bacterium]
MKLALKGFAWAAAAVALLAAGFVALNWAPDRPVAALEARWAAPPSMFVEVSGMRVHVRDEGPRDDPTPVVLLHGTSASLHTWQGWAEALRGERRVIRFDLPGFGLTGPTPDGVYTMDAYVRFVLTTLDRLGVQRAVLAGNSFGGNVAWATALAAPDRVAKLVLVDSAGYPMNPKSVPIGFRIARVPVLNRVGEVALPRRVIESSVRNVYGDPDKVTPELVDLYYDITVREGNRRALAERWRQAPAGANPERIREIKVPTLILWGALDRLIPPEDGAQFQRDIAGSRLVVFGDLGHVPHEEDPVRTVAVVKRFLSSD